jgi:hypothetical protein
MRAVLTMPLPFALRRVASRDVPRSRRGGGGAEEPAVPDALAYALALGGAATLAYADFSAANENESKHAIPDELETER